MSPLFLLLSLAVLLFNAGPVAAAFPSKLWMPVGALGFVGLLPACGRAVITKCIVGSGIDFGQDYLAVAANLSLAEAGGETGLQVAANLFGIEDMSLAEVGARIQLRDAPLNPVTIDTYLHVVAGNWSAKAGFMDGEQIDRQMDVLNTAFATSEIQFVLKNIDITISDVWTANDLVKARYMDNWLRKGDYKTLNIFFVNELDGGAGLGYSTIPRLETPNDWQVRYDGIIVTSSTAPGGSLADYNQGKTLVHEIGHWLGLHHTFEGGCDGPGDSMDDIPREKHASYSCDSGSTTCQSDENPGGDPIHNYMDFSPDDCAIEFTPNQVVRMHTWWKQRVHNTRRRRIFQA